MYGLKRDSYRLRCKGFSGFSDRRPGTHSADNCLCCGRYMEHLNYQGLCQTYECRALLAKMCIEGHMGLVTKEGADTWIIIKPAKLIEERQRLFDEATEIPTETLDDNWCECGKSMKLPRKDYCAVCYRTANVQKARGARRKPRKRRKQSVNNRIRGLEKIKLA